MSEKNEKPQKLKSIKSSIFSRGLAMTKTTIAMGAELASHAVGGVFSESPKADRIKDLVTSQMGILSKELGELKGSLMKAGQMLSMYGEYFLPPEATQLLRPLQNKTPELEWAAIHKVLLAELGEEKLAKLEIEEDPIGTASLGQVHRARLKGTNQYISLKVQYPGVERAIDSDLAALKRLLGLAKILPKEMSTDALFAEIRTMLTQEVDYKIEKNFTERFREILKDDSRYVVPKVYEEFSNSHILATSFEVGAPVLSDQVLSLPQERKNKIGEAIVELYLKEVFELGMVQTDPHFGNYLVRIDPVGDNDVLVLLDFGATREYEQEFITSYREMVKSSVLQNEGALIRVCVKMGFIQEGDSPELKRNFCDLCYELCEPFLRPDQKWAHPELMDSEGRYDWGKSDLPHRLTKKGTQVAYASKFRTPPRQIIFLDRKMTGLFIFLQKLKVKIDTRSLIEKYF